MVSLQPSSSSTQELFDVDDNRKPPLSQLYVDCLSSLVGLDRAKSIIHKNSDGPLETCLKSLVDISAAERDISRLAYDRSVAVDGASYLYDFADRINFDKHRPHSSRRPRLTFVESCTTLKQSLASIPDDNVLERVLIAWACRTY